MTTTMCEHPGCTLPHTWCQIDHLTEWDHHGPTNQNDAGFGTWAILSRIA